jgi:hypothetical protein
LIIPPPGEQLVEGVWLLQGVNRVPLPGGGSVLPAIWLVSNAVYGPTQHGFTQVTVDKPVTVHNFLF